MSGILTAKLGLYKPDPNDFANVGTDINANLDKIDAAAGPTLCTSGTRPGTPYIGQIIYETDTNRILVRTDDGFWTTITGRKIPAVQKTTDTTAGTVITGTSGSLGLLAGIRGDGATPYEFRGSWGGLTSSATAVAATDCLVIVIQRFVAGNVVSGQTMMTNYYGVGLNASYGNFGGSIILEDTPPVGDWDYRLRAVRNAGSLTYTAQAAAGYPTRFGVEEIPGAKYAT